MTAPTPALRCLQLTVQFGSVPVLLGLDLEVESGETMALLGPSGSGKTTLLYTVAGLIDPGSGTIEIDGRSVGPETGPESRSIGMVFQNYALWPHLDALATVAYPMLRAGVPKARAAVRAAQLLDLVGIGGLGSRLPDQLSGGQQQRVGLARALAAEPALYLFDEPTAHLDAAVRGALQAELIAQRARTAAAAVYATHDAAEALSVADRVAVLRDGRIAQVGRPTDVYERPIDGWTAALTGPASVIACALVGVTDAEVTVDVAGSRVTVPGGASCPPGPAALIVRPEWAELGGTLEGQLSATRYAGPHTDYTMATSGGAITIRSQGPIGSPAPTGWSLSRAWVVAPDVV